MTPTSKSRGYASHPFWQAVAIMVFAYVLLAFIVPVLPSPIDMKAVAHFMEELLELGKVQREQARLGLMANRVRENTLLLEELDSYLGKFKVPYLSSLRQSTNYLRAYQRGMGVLELPEYLASTDWEQWAPITKWLNSKRSQPT